MTNKSKNSIVAIIGRPNVGKSTLFNRLIGKKKAIEFDKAGTTRDKLYDEVFWSGKNFILVDTAGFKIKSKDELEIKTLEAVESALLESDIILFVVDFRKGVTEEDLEIAKKLRRKKKKVILAVNKCDNKFDNKHLTLFKRLGFPKMVLVSAISGRGSGDLLDLLCHGNISEKTSVKDQGELIDLAIVGRPNVGKSSLVNALIGDSKMIVSSLPGTTRDSQDYSIRHKNYIINFVDTAGLRKKSKIARDSVESYALLRAIRAIRGSKVVAYLCDVEGDLTSFDQNMIGQAIKMGKSIIIVINKLDKWTDDQNTKMSRYIRVLQEKLNFIPYVPVIFISAKDKTHLNSFKNLAVQVFIDRQKICSQKIVNEIFAQARSDHSQISYITKLVYIKTNPPIFNVKMKKNKKLHFSHKRYLENKIRDTYPFIGTPIFIDQK